MFDDVSPPVLGFMRMLHFLDAIWFPEQPEFTHSASVNLHYLMYSGTQVSSLGEVYF
jgi:hypothetical protein